MNANHEEKEAASAPQRIFIGIVSLLLAALFSTVSIGVLQLSIEAGLTLAGVHIYTLVVFFLAYVFSSAAYTLLLKPDRNIFPPYFLFLLLAMTCTGLFAFTLSMILGLSGHVAFNVGAIGLIKGIFIGLSGLAVFGMALVQQFRKLRAGRSKAPASTGRS